MAAAGDTRVARRYAGALFEVAQQQGKLDAVTRDIEMILDLMRQTPALQQLWDSPLIPAGRKRDLLGQVFHSGVDGLTLSFLRLLVDKRREETLDAVHTELRHLADVAHRLLRAQGTFAVQPTQEELDGLVRSLEQRTGEHVQLTVHVEPAILGGVVVRMEDTILDGSVRGALERMREQLLQEA